MATQTFFIFNPIPGEIIQFWRAYFSNGLKPPTRKSCAAGCEVLLSFPSWNPGRQLLGFAEKMRIVHGSVDRCSWLYPGSLHPSSLTWNLTMMGSKMNLLFQHQNQTFQVPCLALASVMMAFSKSWVVTFYLFILFILLRCNCERIHDHRLWYTKSNKNGWFVFFCGRPKRCEISHHRYPKWCHMWSREMQFSPSIFGRNLPEELRSSTGLGPPRPMSVHQKSHRRWSWV